MTPVTFGRECLFGEVVAGEIWLNVFGEAARQEWFKTAEVRANVALHPDEVIIMPNHVHGVIWILETHGRRDAAPLRPYQDAPFRKNVVPGSLGAIVRANKSAVTKQINIIRGTSGAPVWVRNYYEHIIRDED